MYFSDRTLNEHCSWLVFLGTTRNEVVSFWISEKRETTKVVSTFSASQIARASQISTLTLGLWGQAFKFQCRLFLFHLEKLCFFLRVSSFTQKYKFLVAESKKLYCPQRVTVFWVSDSFWEWHHNLVS